MCELTVLLLLSPSLTFVSSPHTSLSSLASAIARRASFVRSKVCLVCLGGVFAGLTLGLLSLDSVHLKVLSEAGKSEKEKDQAKTVLGLFEGGGRHTLLVVLLLGVSVSERGWEAGEAGET